MKTHYVKKLTHDAKDEGDFYYSRRYGGYYRRIRTFQEIRQNEAHLREHGQGCGIRLGRNNATLNSWNDFMVSRQYKKTWKDFTRYRKQWMVGDDPAPIPPRHRSWWVWL